MDPVPDPILLEKCIGYSRESNPGPLGWQSDVLTTIPNRWSVVTGVNADGQLWCIVEFIIVPLPQPHDSIGVASQLLDDNTESVT